MEQINFLNIEYFFLLIYNFFTGSKGAELPVHIYNLWITYAKISTLIVLFLLSVSIYSYIKLRGIRYKEKKFYKEVLVKESAEKVRDSRWDHVEQLVLSDNENDWRQAVIEADVMLDEMLKNMGYAGDTLGERLKSIEGSDFETLNDAWEAHKIRNQIAHAGSDYHFDRRTAQHAINLFRNVFRANYVI